MNGSIGLYVKFKIAILQNVQSQGNVYCYYNNVLLIL